MKKLMALAILFMFAQNGFCQQKNDKELVKKEIYQTEKAFEKMVQEQGITEAFYYYADSLAVIKRDNDSLIYGKNSIKNFYEKKNYSNVTVNWTPDFIDVSNDGTLGYSYGKYVFRMKQQDNSVKEFVGAFQTVWKKQSDNTWKYVFD
jgi:ketosteroid isomerase-like protein